MFKNSHGDITALVNGGNITKRYDDDAYGVEKNIDTIDTNPFRYCGEYYDAESRSIYLRNRYYSPSIGRFITEDPIKDGLNWYVYCGNNPIMFIDAFGLKGSFVGDKQYWEMSFNDIQTLTDDKLTYDKDTGEITIVEYGEGEKIAGTELVRSILENENFQLDIQRNGYDSDGDKLSTALYNGKSSGGLININDEQNAITKVLTENEDGTISYEVTPSFIVLGHEMIHGYHHMTNTRIYTNFGKHFYMGTKGLVCEKSMDMSVYDEEFETVGLNYIYMYNPKPDPRSINKNVVLAAHNSISENRLRVENGLGKRIAYDIERR